VGLVGGQKSTDKAATSQQSTFYKPLIDWWERNPKQWSIWTIPIVVVITVALVGICVYYCCGRYCGCDDQVIRINLRICGDRRGRRRGGRSRSRSYSRTPSLDAGRISITQ